MLKDLKYADTHEWVKVEGDSATVGITDHAQVDTFSYFYPVNLECKAIVGLGPPYVRLSGAVVLIYTDIHNECNLLPRHQVPIYSIMFNTQHYGLRCLKKSSGFQDHLGDVVYVELPEVGISVSQGKNFGAVESVKATSDINSPVSGEVVEVNGKLGEEPGLVSVATHVSLNSEIKLPWVD